MAKRQSKEKQKKNIEEVLSIGPAISRGEQSQFGLVHTKGRPDYAKLDSMLLDPTIANATELISCAITNSVGSYDHNNTAIKDYINRQLEGLYGDFGQIIRIICSAFWEGMAVIEICAEVSDRELKLTKLVPIPQKNVYLRFADNGTSLDIEEIVLNYSTINEVIMPKEKAIVLRLDPSYIYPYGVSRLLCVQDSWERLTKLKQNWSNASDRYSVPFMVYHLQNPRQKLDDGMGGTVTAYDNARRMLSGQGLVKGTICCGEDSVDLISPEEISSSMVGACEYYEKLIYRGLLIPSLLTDSGDVGSYALGKEHSDLFSMVINNLASVVKDCLLEQLIRPLVSYQFGPQDNWGDFVKKEDENVTNVNE